MQNYGFYVPPATEGSYKLREPVQWFLVLVYWIIPGLILLGLVQSRNKSARQIGWAIIFTPALVVSMYVLFYILFNWTPVPEWVQEHYSKP